jgi:hypothetical protein|nr:hypothetical protein [Neorhizobium tomejilense]
MNKTTARRTYLGNLIGILGAAVNAAAAVENRRNPRSADLRTLGIDPAAFPDVRRA